MRREEQITSSSNTKVTVNLPGVVVRELKELAKANNVTMTDLIAQSIRLNNFLSDREREGGKRGGSVCLNSSGAFAKWFSALVRLPSGLMAAR